MTREHNKIFRRINELEKKIGELKRRMPAHSPPVGMVQDLEELEEELENKRKGFSKTGLAPASDVFNREEKTAG